MDDPDWMNNFKTPGEGVVMLSSSSPSSSSSREANRKTDSAIERAGKEAQDDNGRGKSDDEDSPLITAYVRSGKGSRGSGRGAGSVVGHISSTSSKAAKQSPGKRKGAGVTRKRMRDDAQDQVDDDDDDDGDGNDGDDDEKETVVISSKRSRGVKRALESDEDVEWSPSKSRKVSASPLVKGDGNGAQPKSSRKGRRVSFSGDDEVMKQKKVKRTVSPKDSVDKEEDEDSLPLSVLVKKSKKVTNIDGGSQAENVIDTKVEQRVTTSALEENSSDVPSLSLLRNASDKVVADRDSALLVKGEAVNEDEIGAETSEKKAKSRASSSMPVVFADRVQRTKVLLECEGDAMDLSGDMGAVGRFSTSSGSGNVDDDLLLDLKGILYKTTIVPTNTFFVVNVGQTEAKVEAIMNDFMQLRPDVNQVEDETVVEGTLEGFSFDLETEGDPLGTPATASGPVDSDADEESNPKKKSPTKAQKQRKAGKGSNAATNTRPKGTGKGAPKKPRPKAKTGAKKPSKAKPSKAKPSKAKPSVVKSK